MPDSGQYCGQPKFGAKHMLIDIWERVLGALEGGKDAAVLLGVDYKKAFNRMEHAVCLERLEQLGASRGSVSLVAAFLENRKMTITIDGYMAEPVGIWRGSPQGSVLGCLLYCIATQLLTKGLREEHRLLGPQVPPQAIMLSVKLANRRSSSKSMIRLSSTVFLWSPLSDTVPPPKLWKNSKTWQ